MQGGKNLQHLLFKCGFQASFFFFFYSLSLFFFWAYLTMSVFMNYIQYEIYIRAVLSNFKPLQDCVLSAASTYEPHYKNILLQIYQYKYLPSNKHIIMQTYCFHTSLSFYQTS
jgi:hypothetical protein